MKRIRLRHDHLFYHPEFAKIYSITYNQSMPIQSDNSQGAPTLEQNQSFHYIPQINKEGEDFTHVIYENKLNPSFTQTRALFVANLNPTMDAAIFKQILEEEAARENCTIERAWLNSKRTYCYVLVSDVPGATSIRSRLNNSTIPNVLDDGIKIYVDYIPVRALDLWIEQEKDAPADAIWKISYQTVPSKIYIGTSFKKVLHEMVNYKNPNSGYVNFRKSYHGSNNKRNDLYDRKYSKKSNKSSKSIKHTEKPHLRRRDNLSHLEDNSNTQRRRKKSESGRQNRRSDVYIPDY